LRKSKIKKNGETARKADSGHPTGSKAKGLRLAAKITGAVLCGLIAVALIINAYVVAVAKKDIIKPYELADWATQTGEDGVTCVIVLGAAIWDGKPSPILRNRLDTGMETFVQSGTKIMLLSGDNGTMEYNEVQSMKNYVVENGEEYGITSANIYLDYAGFSTYDSIYRCKEIFGAKRVVIVTQEYHLYRALYIAHSLGLEAKGIEATEIDSGQAIRNMREIPARVKDFILSLVKYKPAILGEPVPLDYPSTQQ